MKKSIILIIITTWLFACQQFSKSAPDIAVSEISDSIKNSPNKKTFDGKEIYTRYKYVDSYGKDIIIQNGFPKGGAKYADKNGDSYNYAVFWTQIMNETDKPLELNIDFPMDSYEVTSLPGEYYKVLIPTDTMRLEKLPLHIYGLTNLKSFLDDNIHKPTSLKRTINPKESNGFYVVILCLTEGAHGTMRTGLSLKGQNLFYRIEINGSNSNSKSSDQEIQCGSINLNNLLLKTQ